MSHCLSSAAVVKSEEGHTSPRTGIQARRPTQERNFREHGGAAEIKSCSKVSLEVSSVT